MQQGQSTIHMKRRTLEFFEGELTRYGDALNPIAQKDQDHRIVKDLLSDSCLDVLLDISCGTGFVAVTALDLGASYVVASDLSRELIDTGRERLGDDSRIQWLVCDAEHLPFNADTFDMATCRYSFHHFPNPAGALREVRRVLKASGRFLLMDPTPLPGEPDRFLNSIFAKVEGQVCGHNKFYTRRQLVKLARSTGLSLLEEKKSTLTTDLSLPGFYEEFQKVGERTLELYDVTIDEEHKAVRISLPVTTLLFTTKIEQEQRVDNGVASHKPREQSR